MKVIKATDAALDAVRKMESVFRTQTGNPSRKQGAFCAEGGTSRYSGPFAVSWNPSRENSVLLSCAPEYMGVSGCCGSILAPDMMIVKHVSSGTSSYIPESGKTLLVLIAEWRLSGSIETHFQFVPDPWTTCSDGDRMIAADEVMPVTEEYPHRNPHIAIYPIARISGTKIVQLQFGHIVDCSRWWRL